MKLKELYCPQCNSIVGRYSTKSKMNYITRCKTCKKRIIYHFDTGEIEIKPLPQRGCSSGLTYC